MAGSYCAISANAWWGFFLVIPSLIIFAIAWILLREALFYRVVGVWTILGPICNIVSCLLLDRCDECKTAWIKKQKEWDFQSMHDAFDDVCDEVEAHWDKVCAHGLVATDIRDIRNRKKRPWLSDIYAMEKLFALISDKIPGFVAQPCKIRYTLDKSIENWRWVRENSPPEPARPLTDLDREYGLYDGDDYSEPGVRKERDVRLRYLLGE